MITTLLNFVKKNKKAKAIKAKLPKVKRPIFTVRVDEMEITDRHWFI